MNLYTEIFIILSIFLTILCGVIATLIFKFNKLENRIIGLLRSTNKNNLEQYILSIYNKLEIIEKEYDKLSIDINLLNRNYNKNIQKVAVVRYKPFESENFSYTVALLDKNDSGLIINSTPSNGASVTHFKYLNQGACAYPLTEEEKEAITKANL